MMTDELILGKPEFDCSKVFQRWRDGWADGSCDWAQTTAVVKNPLIIIAQLSQKLDQKYWISR